MATETIIQIMGKDRLTTFKACKSRAEARRECEMWNARFQMFKNNNRAGYEYANAIIIGPANEFDYSRNARVVEKIVGN